MSLEGQLWDDAPSLFGSGCRSMYIGKHIVDARPNKMFSHKILVCTKARM